MLEYIDGGDLLNYIMQAGDRGEIGLRESQSRDKGAWNANEQFVAEWEAIELTRQICLGMSVSLSDDYGDMAPNLICLSTLLCSTSFVSFLPS